MKLTKNPINTAFCAYEKTIEQSKAGLEFGTIFSEIPLNAGTISVKIKRTPVKIMNILAVNITSWINENARIGIMSKIAHQSNHSLIIF